MKKIRRLLIASVILGVLSFVFFIMGRLAMTDIYHGEPDLTLEWNIVSLSFLPILIFHVLSVTASVMAIRLVRNNALH